MCDPDISDVLRPANIPEQTELFISCTRIAAKILNGMVDLYGRDLLFSGLDKTELEHDELLRLMAAKTDNNRIRQLISDDASRLMTPLIEYQELFLPTNTRTLEENQAVISRIQQDLLNAIASFGFGFETRR